MIAGSEKLDPTLPAAEQRPVAGYVPGRAMTLVRNPSWDPATDPLRPALSDRIEMRLGGSLGQAARDVDAGRVDLASQLVFPPERPGSPDPSLPR
jgi:hypothetical protein